MTAGAIASLTVATVAWAGPDSGPAGPSANRTSATLSAPGFQPDSQLAFVPVSPCQVVNTGRIHKKLGTKATKTYAIAGTAGFAGQGGHANGCNVPTSAVAVSLNLLASKATRSGSVAVSAGDQQPNQTFLAYHAKQATTGALTSKLGPSPSAGIKVRNTGGPTNLTVVVTGYYDRPLQVMLSPSGTLYAGSSRAISASRIGTGNYVVQFDRDIEFCSATATVYAANYFAATSTYYSSPYDSVQVKVFDATGAPVDQYVYVNVSC
jgi:hypothetical protein